MVEARFERSATIHWTTVFKYRASKLPRDPLPEHRKLYGSIAEADADGAMKAAQELVQLALQDTRLSLQHRSAEAVSRKPHPKGSPSTA